MTLGQGPSGQNDSTPAILAGIASARLITEPRMWINRRVETIELLTHEETRRRVSIDFTLLPELRRHLELDDGVAVPIAVLTKEPRRKFDLRDEGGRAVPVLGRTQNGELAHLALLSAALDALGSEPPGEIFEDITAHLRRIVVEPPPVASEQLAYFIGSAEEGDELRALIWNDVTCRQLLVTLWQNYVLYAVVDGSSASRRILKYSYAEDFAYAASQWGCRDQLAGDGLSTRIDRPDRARFVIDCPDAARAASFHVEIATPEELRFEFAVLLDTTADEQLSEADQNVDRASLYAYRTVPRGAHVQAYVEIAPERHGRTFHAAATSVVVALLLWLGVASGLDSENPRGCCLDPPRRSRALLWPFRQSRDAQARADRVRRDQPMVGRGHSCGAHRLGDARNGVSGETACERMARCRDRVHDRGRAVGLVCAPGTQVE